VTAGPHQGQPVRTMGVPLERARAAMIMVHGRGATAESILTLARALDIEGFAFLAPQASGNTWYPFSFLSPVERNEPGISSGLQAIDDLVVTVGEAGIPAERTMLLGFSQGACLTLEYAARHARHYGGIAGLSGGLIGPDGIARDYPGTFDNAPVYLGCSDVDGHIPVTRLRETDEVLSRMGANVRLQLFPGMGHLVDEEEIEAVRALMREAVA
jgi:predicted esterase